MLESYCPGKDYSDIKKIIKGAERAVIEKCWNEEDKAFYSLRNGKEQLKHLTIASLFPILIRDLPRDMTKAIVEALQDKEKFYTPYPVPTVSVSHPKFDAQSTWPIWRGPTWINTNWFLIRGLLRNAHPDLARYIATRSIEMVTKNGFYEFYQPFSGKGLRVKNFGWSTLVVTF